MFVNSCKNYLIQALLENSFFKEELKNLKDVQQKLNDDLKDVRKRFNKSDFILAVSAV